MLLPLFSFVLSVRECFPCSTRPASAARGRSFLACLASRPRSSWARCSCYYREAVAEPPCAVKVTDWLAFPEVCLRDEASGGVPSRSTYWDAASAVLLGLGTFWPSEFIPF